MKCRSFVGSSRWSGELLHAGDGSHEPADGEGVLCVSFNEHRYRLFNGFFGGFFGMGSMSEGSVGFQHKDERLFQVALGFGQCPSLGIHTRDFLNVGNVPFAFLGIDSRKLTDHNDDTIPKRSIAVNPAITPVGDFKGQSEASGGRQSSATADG